MPGEPVRSCSGFGMILVAVHLLLIITWRLRFLSFGRHSVLKLGVRRKMCATGIASAFENRRLPATPHWQS